MKVVGLPHKNITVFSLFYVNPALRKLDTKLKQALLPAPRHGPPLRYSLGKVLSISSDLHQVFVAI